MISLAGIMKVDMSYPGLEISVELTVLREYLSQMDSGIKLLCEEYADNELKKYDGCEYYEYQHIYRISEHEMPRIIRMPFIVTIYTLFENSVSLLLTYAQGKENKELALKDINGRTLVSTFNKYMKHVLDFEYEFSNEVAERFSNLNKVRNCIAHTNGNLSSLSDKKLEELKRLSVKMSGLKVRHNELELTTEFLENAMKFVEINLKELMGYMDSRYGWN